MSEPVSDLAIVGNTKKLVIDPNGMKPRRFFIIEK